MSRIEATPETAYDQLNSPAYPSAEAGRLVGLSATRVRRWLMGYEYECGQTTKRQRPVIQRSDTTGTSYASFLELVDLLFAKRFLDRGFSLQKVRKAFDEATEILGINHFARQSFFTHGSAIFLQLERKGKAVLELLSGGQWIIPDVITKLGHQIDFDDQSELASKWYPFGPEGLVVLDPLRSFGRPIIVGKGVATENAHGLFKAEGNNVQPVCSWLGLSEAEVKAAVEFERHLAA